MNTAATSDRFSEFVLNSQTAVVHPWYTVTVYAKIGDDLIPFETELRASNVSKAIQKAICRVAPGTETDIRRVDISEPRSTK